MISELILEAEHKAYLTFNDLLDIDRVAFETLSASLNTTNARQLLYHYKNNTVSKPTCPVCASELNWNSDSRSYRKFCSKKCTGVGTATQAIDTHIKKYGQHYSTTNEFKSKVRDTSLSKFGVDHYSKTSEFNERTQSTNLERLGVSYPAQSADVKNKTKDTLLEKYGVENVMHDPKCVNKVKSTKRDRYNNPAYNNTSKRIQTNLEKYGVAHPLQDNTIQEKSVLTRKTNYYNPVVLERLNNQGWLKEQFDSGLTVGEIADSLGVSSSNLCKYFSRHNIDVNIGRNTSSIEREIVNFLVSLGVTSIVTNTRAILNGKEIDIYLPEHHLAIEVNGLYWHCESQGKTKFYHYNKSKECLQKGIQLLHIIDISWTSKKEIWKSIIKSKLQLNHKIYARKCTISEIDTQTARQFLDCNHLSGYVGGCKKLGLFYNSELVQVVILGKARFNKKYDYELIRLASKINTNIVGGASKLLSKISGSIVSYADLAYSQGNVYKNLGFEQVGPVSINYYYIKNNRLESRNKYQKHKLSKILQNFNASLTEWENMKNNGYDRYWDSGQLTFVKC